MKTTLAFLILVFFLPHLTFGDDYGDIVRYKYNPIEDWWKFRSNKSALHYNPMADEFTYKYPGQQLRFNPAEETWEFAEKEKQLHYDILRDKWFFFGEYYLSEKEETKPVKKLTPLSPTE
jgi:hypothetical protein